MLFLANCEADYFQEGDWTARNARDGVDLPAGQIKLGDPVLTFVSLLGCRAYGTL